MKKVKKYIDDNNPVNSTKPLNEQIEFLEEEFFISKKASLEILNYCNFHNVNAFVAMNNLGLRMCMTSKFEYLEGVYEILKNISIQEIKENYSKYFSIVMKETRGSMNPTSLEKIFDKIFELESLNH